jgi:beta-1,4-mannosyl-glycoprotein beta-1,4-N-acetylglucosaminyltransferase
MVITCQPFLNEIERMLIKMETLKGVVDLHVIAEAPITFTGVNKPMYFQQNRHRFEGYPVHYIELSGLPETKAMKLDPWAREEFQRKTIVESLKKISPEIVLFGDADETPKPDVVERFRKLNTPTANLEMDMLLYYFNRVGYEPWRYQRICKWQGKVADRGNWNHPIIKDAGWHFEYFGDKSTLLEKINASSHGVEECGRIFFQAVSRGEKPGLENTTEYPEEKLPQVVRDYRERYASWFMS